MLQMKAIRARNGITLAALAESTGLNATALSRYENGHVSPSVERAGLVARALGVSLDDLLGNVHPQEPTTPDGPQVIAVETF